VEALTHVSRRCDKGLEAKILHHAITCFKQSSASYTCRRGVFDDVPRTNRAGWCRPLKAMHAATSRAAKTPYYH
jgi:hypothetical protein